MKLQYHVLDVFTARIFRGTPLAVVFAGDALDGALMQQIAAEFNLSETVFVLPAGSPTATRRVRIFTPRAEVPFAGHPTIGTALLLARLGACDLAAEHPQIVLEEGVGPVAVRISCDNGQARAAQMAVPQLPEPVASPLTLKQAAELLSLQSGDLHPDIRPQAWSCGLPFLYLPLAGVAAVQRARLRLDLWQQWLAPTPACNVYPFSFETLDRDAQIHSRMFAPEVGIVEDPATGSAAAALAGLLATVAPSGAQRWRVEQGIEMGRPARIELTFRCIQGKAVDLTVGGTAVPVAEGILTV